MKPAALFIAIILAALVAPVYSYSANSTSSKVFLAIDSAGGTASSANYKALAEVSDYAGLAASASSKVCVGYVCVEYGPQGQIMRVSFLMDLNINGPSNDIAYVDTSTALGVYNSSGVSGMFGCVQDSSLQGNPAFGIVFAGTKMNYVSLNQNENYSIKMSQDRAGNRFLLPVTTGGCSTLKSSMPLPVPFIAFVPFQNLVGFTELSISYPIDLVNNFEKTGSFTLVLEKNETSKIAGSTP